MNSDQLYTEWPIGSHSALLGTAGIVDSCSADTNFEYQILVDGAARHSGTLQVGAPVSLSVDIGGGTRVGILLLNPYKFYDECASVGELRIE